MSRWRRELAIFAALAAAAVIFTWPMPAYLGSKIWGDRFDAWTTLWLIWHLGDSATQLSAFTDRILYPIGYDLWSFGHLALQALGVPLLWLGVPLVATYNLLALGALVFSGRAAWALGEALVARGRPELPGEAKLAGGLFSAAIFAFNPYLYGELRAGCLELVAAGFLPLFLLMLLRVADRPGWRTVLPAALVLAITGPFNWYYAVFAGMLGVAFAGAQALAGARRATLAVVASLALGLAMVGPLLPLVRRETPSRPPISQEQFTPERWARSRLLSDSKVPLAEISERDLLDQDALQVVLNSTSLQAMLKMDFPTNPLESTPGRLAWGLGLLGWAAAGRRGRVWGTLALGFSVLTLGPYVLVDQSPPLSPWALDHPLPYQWLYNHVPLFSKAYRPYRIGVIVLTCLAALAAVGVARLSSGTPTQERRWSRRLLLGGVAALGLSASQPHWAANHPAGGALADARPEAVYAPLAGRPGALIELPLHAQPVSVAAAQVQLHQVEHRRPMLNCNQLIRRTELAAFQRYVTANGLLSSFVDLARSEPPWSWRGEDAQKLLDDGFVDLVLRTRLPAEAEHLAGYQESADRLGLAALGLLEDSFGPPWLDADGLMAFALRPVSPGLHTWTGDAVEAVSNPQADLGLPVDLRPGQHLDLASGEGPARRFGVWVLAEGSGISLRVKRSGVSEDLPVDGQAQAPAWVWMRAPLGEGPWAVSLVGEGRAWLARPEVER